MQDLPPFTGPGREQNAFFLGGGSGHSAPAVVADQLHDGLDAQHQTDENSRQGKNIQQQIPDGVGRAKLQPELKQGTGQQPPVASDGAFFHGGADVFHLYHRVRLNRDGVRRGIAEDLHLIAVGHQLPAGGFAQLPELPLLRRRLRVKLTGLGKVHHGVVSLRRLAPPVGPEHGPGLFQLPALTGHVLQMADDPGVVIVGIEIDLPFFLSVKKLHDSISPLRPM